MNKKQKRLWRKLEKETEDFIEEYLDAKKSKKWR
jgi:hypothetical protein